VKYSINVNQVGVAEAGLADKTDLVDWSLLDYILSWSTNPSAQRLGDAVWVNYKHFIVEMPLLGLKTKGAVANRIEKLRKLDLIRTKADESQRVFVQLTERFHEVVCFRGSRPPVHQNEQTVHDGEHSLVNQNRHLRHQGCRHVRTKKSSRFITKNSLLDRGFCCPDSRAASVRNSSLRDGVRTNATARWNFGRSTFPQRQKLSG